MSNSTLLRWAGLVFSAFALLAVTTACGGSTGAPRPSPSVDVFLQNHRCLDGAKATVTSLPDGTQPLKFATLGRGPSAVILSNQSNQDLCSWLAFAKTLAGRGFRAVLYDYAIAPEYDLPMISTYLRGHGVTSLALLGASLGGMGTIVAAADLHPAPQAVITLSAESTYGGADVVTYAARITAPVLFVAARNDDGPLSQPTNPSFYRAAPAAVKKLVVVPGAEHGTALLVHSAIVSTLVAFLRAHDS